MLLATTLPNKRQRPLPQILPPPPVLPMSEITNNVYCGPDQMETCLFVAKYTNIKEEMIINAS